MTPALFDQCSTCDARADRAGNRAVADALREFMTKNHVKLAVESGDVVVTENLPNQRIDTGHSCSKTAEARDGKITARMVGTSAELDSLDIDYFGEIYNSFISGLVPHEVTLNANIRVSFGVKFFGSCKRVGRKTCSIKGSSTGKNNIYVNLAASDVSTTLINGKEHLQFVLDVEVIDESDPTSYNPLSIPKGSGCDILGGLGSINSYIKKYADSFLGKNRDKITKLRGSRLVQKLEDVLKARLKSTVTIPVNVSGGGRRKRAATTGCQRMKCPNGFTRIGNSDKCQKFMGSRSPNCSQYGKTSTVYARKLGRRNFYWCRTHMVPV